LNSGGHASRICLLSPGHLSTNPRLVKEADALTNAGYEVSVIAADFSPWGREADREFAGRRWRVANTLKFGPSAPKPNRIVQIMRQRGAAAMFGSGVRHRLVAEAAWHPITPDLIAAARRLPANLYIAHYPAALPAAGIAAKTHGAKYAFDAEDFHLGDPPDLPASIFPRRLIRTIEAHYLPGCAYVTAASPGIARAYRDAYGISEPTVVLNTFPRRHGPSGPTAAGAIRPGPSLYWFSQTIGPDRGLESALRAIGLSRSKPHLFLRGHVAAGFERALRDIADASGIADRLHFLAPAPPGDMERLAADYDIGLASETGNTRNRRIALANKLFSYLAAGIPVAMSNIPAHCAIFPELGDAARLFAVDDPQSLAEALDALLADPKALAVARSAAFVLGRDRFNWEIEQGHLLVCVRNALGAENKQDARRAGRGPC